MRARGGIISLCLSEVFECMGDNDTHVSGVGTGAASHTVHVAGQHACVACREIKPSKVEDKRLLYWWVEDCVKKRRVLNLSPHMRSWFVHV
jgi:hypothetical protein